MAKGQTRKVATNHNTPRVSELVSQSATLSHLQSYGKGVSTTVAEWLPWTLVSALASVLIAAASTTKQYMVDSPGSPAVIKAAYRYLLLGVRALDNAVSTLLLRDGIDAFLEQYIMHGRALGLWTAYFALDFTANVSNYLIRGFVVQPLKVSYQPMARGADTAGSVARRSETPASSAGSDMPHLRELTNTTNALRRDFSTKYIEPTRNKIESYLEPTRNKLEAQYIHPINEGVESTKTLFNNTYRLVKPTYEAAYETVSRTYEGNLSSHDSVSRAIVSTGVDLGSKTLEKIRSMTRSADGSEDEAGSAGSHDGANGVCSANGSVHKTNGASRAHASNGVNGAHENGSSKARRAGTGASAAADENSAS